MVGLPASSPSSASQRSLMLISVSVTAAWVARSYTASKGSRPMASAASSPVSRWALTAAIAAAAPTL
ncbi:hypothetical protein [Nonomuraea salmonea]|uniref:hypothetical protein n=1 Tax=Nonomuraea salmonea TaxID=46181 RepID=UPI003CD06AF3